MVQLINLLQDAHTKFYTHLKHMSSLYSKLDKQCTLTAIPD